MRQEGRQRWLGLDYRVNIYFLKEWKKTLTSRICLAPENYRLVLVLGRTKDIMELNGKPVQVSNVQWSKVMMEGIV